MHRPGQLQVDKVIHPPRLCEVVKDVGLGLKVSVSGSIREVRFDIRKRSNIVANDFTDEVQLEVRQVSVNKSAVGVLSLDNRHGVVDLVVAELVG